MKRTNVTSLALAAGCMIALAVPAAQAQTYNRSGGNPALNNAESAKYDRIVETSPGFRQARMRKECGPITDPQLRENCFASFAQYEPSTGSRGRTMARGTTATGDFYTGSSTNPGMTNYGAGWGESTPYTMDNNHTSVRNSFDASRNLPGEYSAGMVQAPGAMPNYPGPRPSGPLSGR